MQFSGEKKEVRISDQNILLSTTCLFKAGRYRKQTQTQTSSTYARSQMMRGQIVGGGEGGQIDRKGLQ